MEGRILKARTEAESDLPAGVKVLKGQVYTARLDAGEIVETARAGAAAIVAEAEAQRAAVLEAAREEGYKDGLAHWNEAVAGVLDKRDAFLRDCEGEVLRLAVRIAEKIIGEQLRLDPSTITGIVREALKSVRREKSLSIQVHPDHLDQLRQEIHSLEEAVGVSREIDISSNPKVEPGGCVVMTELGVIDAQLKTQLQCMEKLLLRESR